MNTTTITNREYRELIAAKQTLLLIESLMCKELGDDERSYVCGKTYLDIIETFWGAMEVNNAG